METRFSALKDLYACVPHSTIGTIPSERSTISCGAYPISVRISPLAFRKVTVCGADFKALRMFCAIMVLVLDDDYATNGTGPAAAKLNFNTSQKECDSIGPFLFRNSSSEERAFRVALKAQIQIRIEPFNLVSVGHDRVSVEHVESIGRPWPPVKW